MHTRVNKGIPFLVKGYRWLTAAFLFVLLPVTGQFYEYGQDPASTRWSQFHSPHYHLIYPRGLDSLAMDFADKMEYFYPHQAKVLDHSHGKMPVIFHNQSSFSNGVFVWAPKRLEVFTNPNPNGYPQDWMTQLALHEGRHAVQVSKLNQGMSKALSYVAGEQAVGLVTGMLPLWYLEGDAVDAETRFSRTGRGRLPSFDMGMRAILLEGEQKPGFSKATLGSYKDYVPNHYQLGYFMVRYARRTFGDSFWQDVEETTARKPYLISPSYFSMRKYGIRSKGDLYNKTMNFYREHWSAFDSLNVHSYAEPWNLKVSRSYVNYHFPTYLDDSTLVTLKSGPDQIPAFVKVSSTGEERVIFRPGYMNSGKFSLAGDLLVWDEWVPDVRWSNRNFSILRIYDMKSRVVRNLTSRSRYYAPSISRETGRIVAVEQQTDHSFYLVVLDLEGKEILREKAPNGKYIQHPEWMGGEEMILLTWTDDQGESLVLFDPKIRKWKPIFQSGFEDISYPRPKDSNIYFSSTFNGVDNIYVYVLEEDKIFRVTIARFGGFEQDISPEGTEMVFVNYTIGGMNISKQAVDPARWIPLETDSMILAHVDEQSTMEEDRIIDSALTIPEGEYTPKPYRKMLNAINIHSWLPLYFDYMDPESALSFSNLPVSPGVTLVSQNLLSTAVGMVGYEYSNQRHYLHSGVRLKGQYPVVDLSMRYGGDPLVAYMDTADVVDVQRNNLNFALSSYVPLRLNTGKFLSLVQPIFSYSYNASVLPNESRTGYQQGVHFFRFRGFATSYLRLGQKDIWPRLGGSLLLSHRSAPFNDYNYGSIRSALATVYLPGPLKHQSFRLRYAAQEQELVRYFYSNDIPLPRGYRMINGRSFQLFSADYTLPIAYPDWSLEPFLYIKRLRSTLWFDYLAGQDVFITNPAPQLVDRDYRSFGIDLEVDLHVIRLFFPMAVGIRNAYLPATGEWRRELLFSIDID